MHGDPDMPPLPRTLAGHSPGQFPPSKFAVSCPIGQFAPWKYSPPNLRPCQLSFTSQLMGLLIFAFGRYIIFRSFRLHAYDQRFYRAA